MLAINNQEVKTRGPIVGIHLKSEKNKSGERYEFVNGESHERNLTVIYYIRVGSI